MDLEKNSFGSVWIATTYNCNNRCRWCYSSSNSLEFRKKELDPSKELPILYLLKELGIKDVKLVGGEPTVYPNISSFVKKLSDLEFQTTLVTNGRKFSDFEFAKSLKDAGLSNVCFSIEGYDSFSHEKESCVKGSFGELMKGLENAKRLGFNIASNTTMTANNNYDLEKIVDFVSNKSDIISFNVCVPWFRTCYDSSSLLSPKEGAKIFERIYLHAKSKDINIKLTTPMPLCNFNSENSKLMQQEEALGGICSIISGQNFVVNYNGDILSCTLFSDFPLFNIFRNGKTINAEQFLEEYNSEGGLSNKLRNKISHFPSKKCNSNCDYFCTGGCPMFWTKYNPEEEVLATN